MLYSGTIDLCVVFINTDAEAEFVHLQFYKRYTIKSPKWDIQKTKPSAPRTGAEHLIFTCICAAVNYQLLETMTGKREFYRLCWHRIADSAIPVQLNEYQSGTLCVQNCSPKEQGV